MLISTHRTNGPPPFTVGIVSALGSGCAVNGRRGCVRWCVDGGRCKRTSVNISNTYAEIDPAMRCEMTMTAYKTHCRTDRRARAVFDLYVSVDFYGKWVMDFTVGQWKQNGKHTRTHSPINSASTLCTVAVCSVHAITRL